MQEKQQNNVNLNFRVPKSMKDDLLERAKEMGISPSFYIRYLILKDLEK